MQAGRLKIDGDATKPAELLGLLDEFNPSFAIVTPRVMARLGVALH